MTDLTRQEIIDAQLARQWAEWNKSCEVSSPEIQAAANFILAHTTPPTMADVEWDDEKHYLAEAEHSEYGKVTMVSKARDTGEIYYLRWGSTGRLMALAAPADLTPTGRRYVLQEGE
ncbi:hypothetical protein QP916_02745 [Corynebacterium accolens]|uniref:hypothetical protein n=1 Tax=Corynebacterium accolens TaxID=38284 RepID=UPI00254F3300|nr:hypothetical protein [Corynebacterium accolens]MDK8497584.1 hypothetical protein [Corynebacterium accolens]